MMRTMTEPSRVNDAAARVAIRRAEASDFGAMWPIFEAVIAMGDTYVLGASTTRDDAREYWFARGVTSWATSMRT